ncbi:MAG TPA: LamG-like jellyroll fold domain-containing protein, partial [Methylomirabilota bacterium]|nr:LamG-like jellyroll fold domain-containing protein [Methylomirabilota bacterium]
MLAVAAATPAPTHAQITFVDPQFVTETVAQLPAFTPVGLTFAPDGRIFIWQKSGIVRIVKDGALLSTPFLDIQSQVNQCNDRGLLGFALDPGFATNGFVYLFHTLEESGNPSSCGAKTSRLIRVTASSINPDVALPASQITILSGIPSDGDSHSVGSLRFAPDGKLFVSHGDGASYSVVDPLALRAQDLNSYNGKILRINPDGSAPGDNPFDDGTNSVRSKVWAYGLRNPFRFTLHPATGEPYIGDVGWNTWEEINHGRGANFGWPCFEGNGPQPDYQAAFLQCRQLSPSAVTPPLYTFDHSVGRTIIGGAFYTGFQYPFQYRGNLFFADYTAEFLARLVFDENSSLASIEPFATGIPGPVDIELGPDGMLYYVAILTGEVGRIRFAGAERPPIAKASASPAAGYSPLTVLFSSAGSVDPDGGPLTYLWDFGDGTTSTLANPQQTFAATGVASFPVTLTVTDVAGSSATDTVVVTVGSLPPTATIGSPVDGTVVVPGQTVTYQGSASDPDEGALPQSALSWTVLLHHNEHVHLLQSGSGGGGSFDVVNHGVGSFAFEIILTATDSSGLTDTRRVFLPMPPVGTPDVVAAYSLNEGQGIVASDSSGNGNTGNIGGATWTSQSVFGTALAFDGVSGFVTVPSNSTLNLSGTGTLEAWVRLNSLGRWHGVIAKGGANNDQAHNYALEITDANRARCIVGNGLTSQLLDSTTTMPASLFRHLACVWNGSTLSLFINGVLNTSTTLTVSPAGNVAPLFIGQFGGNSDRLSGIIDEVRIYNRALSPAEIQFDMNSPIVLVTNTAPSISSIANRTTTIGTPVGPLGFTVGDAETAAASLTVSGASSNPTLVPVAGIGFGGSGGSRTVTVAPVANQSGSTTITITVSDGVLSASSSFVLTVSGPNTPPTISAIGDQATNEDASTGAIAFTVGDNETPAGNLTLSGSSSNPTLVPNGNIAFGGSGANRTVTITPAPNQSGTGVITITVSDGGMSTPTSFGLTVNAVNDAPTITGIANQLTTAGVPVGPLSFTVGDVETLAGSLTVSGSSDNELLVPNGNIAFGGSGANRTVTVTPAPGLVGGATITVTVSDGVASTPTSFGLTVTAMNTAPSISAIADQVTNEDTPTAAIAFTVADGETPAASLSVSGSSNNPTLVPSGNIVFGGSGATRTVTITPAANQSGTTVITITVSDGALSTPTSFGLTVTAMNDAPTITPIANQTTSAGVAVGPLSFTVGDVETAAGSLTVSGISNNPTLVPNGNIVFGGSGANRTVTVTPAVSQTGTVTITVTVSDGTASTPTSFGLTVNAIPAGLRAAYAFNEGQGTNTADASGNLNTGTLTNGPTWTTQGRYGNAITFDGANDFVAAPDGASLDLTTTGTIEAWVRLNAVGRWHGLIAKGNANTDAAHNYALEVTNLNRARCILGNGGSFQVLDSTVMLAAGVFRHLACTWNGTTLALYIDGALNISAAQTVTPAGNTAPLFLGQFGGNSDQLSGILDETRIYDRALSVAEIQADMNTPIATGPNSPPTISAIGNQATNEDTPTAAIGFTVRDNETPVGNLSLSASSSNPTLVPNASIVFGGSGANRTVTLTPAANQSGTATITITVSDGVLTTPTSFGLTVTAVNDAPTMTGIASQFTTAGVAVGPLSFTVGDVETAAGSLSVSGSSDNQLLVPNGNIAFGGSGANRTVTVTPAPGLVGNATITVTVSDGVASTPRSFGLTVTATNTAPSISTIGDQVTNEDTPTGPISFAVADGETPAASLSVNGSSNNPTLVPNGNIVFGGSGANRTVTITPAANQSGTATVTIAVSDGALSTPTSFGLTVTAVNDPPTITAIANQITSAGVAVGPLSFTVGDVETAAASLTVSGSSNSPTLVPTGNIVFGGNGINRTVTVTPAAAQTGTATITVTVSDGTASTPTSFGLTVNAVPAGLRAAYAFNEGQGTSTVDASGNGNTGTLTNGPTWTTQGRYGNAITFDGTNDFVSVPDSASLDLTTTGTIEAWVRLNAVGRWQALIAKGSANNDRSHNYALEVTNRNRARCILGNG